MYHLVISFYFQEKITEHSLENRSLLKIRDAISIPLIKSHDTTCVVTLIKRAVMEHFECKKDTNPTSFLHSIVEKQSVTPYVGAQLYWKQLHGICNQLSDMLSDGFVPNWGETLEVDNLCCELWFRVVKHGRTVDDFTSNTGFINLHAVMGVNDSMLVNDRFLLSTIQKNQEAVIIFNNKKQMDAFVHIVNLMIPFNEYQLMIVDSKGIELTVPALIGVPTICIRVGVIDNRTDVAELSGIIEKDGMNQGQLQSGAYIYFIPGNEKIIELIRNLEGVIGYILSKNNHYEYTYRYVVTNEVYPYTYHKVPKEKQRWPVELFDCDS